jgi:hypothetical protein
MNETLASMLRTITQSFEELPSGIFIQSDFIPGKVGCIFVYDHKGMIKVGGQEGSDFLLGSGDVWYGCFEHESYQPRKGEPTKRKLPYEHLPCCLKDLDVIPLSNGRFLSKRAVSSFSTRYLMYHEHQSEGRKVSAHFEPYNPLEITAYLARNVPLMGISEEDLPKILDDMSGKMEKHIGPSSCLELLAQ